MSDVPVLKPVWPTALAVVGVFAIFLLFWVVVRQPSPVFDQIASIPPEEQWRFSDEGHKARLVEVQGRVRSEINTYKWIDQNAGVVQLPLDRAIELTVNELSAARR
jgi:hypothetical protein